MPCKAPVLPPEGSDQLAKKDPAWHVTFLFAIGFDNADMLRSDEDWYMTQNARI